MNWDFLPDFLSLFPLGWAAYLLMGERKHFQSLVPFMVGVLFLFTGRLSDVVLLLPLATHSRGIGVTPGALTVLVSSLGNLSDAIGALFLVVGFVKTIKYQLSEEKHVKDLESLLPLCAWCKSFRGPNGVWKPIEEYLLESGGPPVTHGICPTCADKRLRGLEESKTR